MQLPGSLATHSEHDYPIENGRATILALKADNSPRRYTIQAALYDS